MKIEITPQEASCHTEHNDIVKHLKVSADQINWSYDWCVKSTIPLMGFEDFISGKAQKTSEMEMKRINSMTLQERLDDIKPRIGCDLFGSFGRKYKRIYLEEVPKQVMDFYEKEFLKEIAEKQRIDSLTEEERHKEIEDCLKQLRGTPGFMEIRI